MLEDEARRRAEEDVGPGEVPTQCRVDAHCQVVAAEAKLGWMSRMVVVSGRNVTQRVPIHDEVTKAKVGTKVIPVDTEGQNQATISARKAMRRRLKSRRNHRKGAKQAMNRYNKEQKNAAKLFQTNSDSLGVTTHAVCILPNQSMNEMVLLDPGKLEPKLLTMVDTVRSTHEFMTALIDYWQVLRVKLKFSAQYQAKCKPEDGPVTHAEWEEMVGDGWTEGDQCDDEDDWHWRNTREKEEVEESEVETMVEESEVAEASTESDIESVVLCDEGTGDERATKRMKTE